MRSRTQLPALTTAVLLTLSCNNAVTEVQTGPVPETTETEPEAIPVMKNMAINAAYYEEAAKQVKPLGEKEMKQLQVEKLTGSDVDPGTASFKVLDTVLSTEKGNVLLIAYETENEQYAWIAAYNGSGTYMSKTEVFYRDVVEYLMNRESEIKDNQVHVTLTTGGDEASSSTTAHYVLNDMQSIEKGK